MDKLVTYSIGIVAASVCVIDTMTTQEIEEEMNIQHSLSNGLRWQISEDTHFKGGKPNPCECNTHPNRKHYLLNC